MKSLNSMRVQTFLLILCFKVERYLLKTIKQKWQKN